MRILLTLLAACYLCTNLHAQEKKRWSVTYHENENIASEGYLVNKKKSGKWKYYDHSGKQTHFITYKNDLRNGWEMYYLPDRDTLRLTYYKDDLPDSTYKEWDADGRLITSGSYRNGKREGTWDYWKAIPSTGQTFVWLVPTITWTVSPIAGQKSKPAPKYVDPGRHVKSETYKNDELDGPFAEYDLVSGAQLVSGVYKAGKKNGPFIETSKDRTSFTERTYRNDTLVKEADLWDQTGTRRKREYELSNGIKNGSYREWHGYTDKEKITGTYRNGLRDGVFIEYNMAGKRHLSYTYKAGVLEGERCDYDSNGNIETRGYLKNSVYDSTFTEYYSGGAKYWEGTCRNGLFQGEYTAYHANGVVKEKGMYSNDVREGTVYGFTTDGRKYYSAGYKNGKLDGLYLEYHANGTVFISQQFSNDTFNGSPTFYNEKGRPIVLAKATDAKETKKNYEVNEPIEVVISTGRSYYNYHGGSRIPEELIKPDLLARLRKDAAEVLEANTKPHSMVPGEEWIVVSENAEFPGGMETFVKYLVKNTHYPAMEREMGVQGSLYLKFTIDKTGALNNVEELKKVEGGPGLSKEAIRALKTSPAWKPAKKNGKPEYAEFIIRFKFVLQ